MILTFEGQRKEKKEKKKQEKAMKAMLRFAGYCGTRGPAYLSLGEQKDEGLQKTREREKGSEKREARKEGRKQRWERETEKNGKSRKKRQNLGFDAFCLLSKGIFAAQKNFKNRRRLKRITQRGECSA